MVRLVLCLLVSCAAAAEPPPTLKWRTQVDNSPAAAVSFERFNKGTAVLTINSSAGKTLVQVDLTTGVVKLYGPAAADEGAHQFWLAVGREFARCTR